MKSKFYAVIDTNVLVSANISQGPPNMIMHYVESGNIIPLFDKRIIKEYITVLKSEKFGFTDQQITDNLSNIINNGILVLDIQKTKQRFKDETDIPFFEISSVTFNG